MNISYLNAQWTSADKQSVLFTDLKIEGESFGNYLADTTSDLGKELLNYIKSNGVEVSLSKENAPLPSINISKETAINNLTSWFKEYVNTQATTKYFMDANDCLSYLQSKDKELQAQAKAFLYWKESCFKILKQFIKDFKDNEITILNFTSSKLLEKLPTLTWELLEEIDLDDYNFIDYISTDTFLDKKAKAFNTLKDTYLKLKSYNCPEMFFSSSIDNIYVNGDLKAKVDLESLISESENTTELIHFKSYSNFWIDLTRDQLKTLYKELLKNQIYINNQYWQKTQQVLEAQNETELSRVSLEFEMGYFGSIKIEQEAGLSPDF